MADITLSIIYTIFFIEFAIAFFFLIFYIKQRSLPTNIKLAYHKITFVIPAYNCANVLEKTIRSIKNAKYDKEKINIIVVNDGSTDNTLKVAKSLEKKYSRVQVFNKTNGGKAEAVNFGIKKVKTPFLVVLDSDTLIKQDLLEKSVSLFSDSATMAVTSRLKPLNNKKLIERMQYVEYTLAGFYRMITSKLSSLPVAPAFTIYRKKFFDKHGYFEKNNLTEDFEMGLRIQSNHYNMGYEAHSYALTVVPDNLHSLIRQRRRWAYGTFYNYKKYRKLFFNSLYGDLGIFILPFGLVSIFIVSIAFLLGIYMLSSWVYNRITWLLAGWIPSFSPDLERLFIASTELRIILMFIAVFIGTIILFITKSEFKEKITLKDYFLTITIYLWILAFTYVLTFAYFLTGKKPKW
ncbi:glycosyltransferase family 2 protein [Candidatus Pacearchaeota archaeon]|nr:glycosyltransferase family 2 protein [Candidatus Pacearchaeota archaeon]